MLPKNLLRACGYALNIGVAVAVIASTALVVAESDRQDVLPTLVYGQTVDGRIDDAQPSAFFAFDGAAEDVVTITMVVTEGNLDPFIVLNTADRTPLATDDNSGGGANARLTFVIPATGQYIIQATHAGGVPPVGGGGYNLNLTAAVDNIPAQPDTETSAQTAPAPRQPDDARLMRLAAGETVQNTLSPQNVMRVYWFEAQTGDQITITPAPGDFQPRLVLYDDAFNRVAARDEGDASSPLSVAIEQSTVHFLAVSLPEASSAGGSYGFVFAHLPNPLTSGNVLDIAYGDSQVGNIDDAVSAATYRFQGASGDNITVSMARAQGDLDSYLYLLDSSGQLLFEDNDSGGSNGDARIEFELPEDGTYLVVATRLGQTQGATSGSFVLELVSDAAPLPVEDTPAPEMSAEFATLPQIAYGDVVDGEISDAKFVDFYVFVGQAGDTITIEMQSGNLDDPGGLDPLLVLLDNARIPLIENDDIVDGQERNARITYTLPATNYYAIVATRFEQSEGATSGPYVLSISGPGASPALPPEAERTLIEKLSPTALLPDVPYQSAFGAAGELFTFATSAEDVIGVTIEIAPAIGALLILADENLNEIASTSTGVLSEVAIPKSGDYLLMALPLRQTVSEDGQSFVLSLSSETPPAEALEPAEKVSQTLTIGDAVNGTIDEQNPSQLYTFTGQSGERIRITMEATPNSDLDCYLELQDETGAVLAASDDIDPGIIRDSQIVTELPADGTYVIVASRFVEPDVATTTGDFRLTLERFDEESIAGINPQTIPLAYGQTEVNEINDDQYLLFYVFDGIEGDTVTIEVEHLSGNLDSVLHLYRSDGDTWVLMTSNDDSPIGGTYAPLLRDITLPQTGKYLIALSRYGLDRETTSGTFALTLTQGS